MRNTYMRGGGTPPNGTYNYGLEVNHVKYNDEPDLPKIWSVSCVSSSALWQPPPPPCLMLAGAEHRLMPPGKFKETFWK